MRIPCFFLMVAGLVLSSCTYRFYDATCELSLPGRMQKQAVIDDRVHESSGLLYMDGDFWSFNDSGGDPVLFRIDPLDGSIKDIKVIGGAVNVDWEDIACDGRWVYLADVGNNYHTRDTLVIYRVPREGLLARKDTVPAEGTIRILFEEIQRHTPSGLSSLDCEALIATGDSLYLFTKDWVEESTSVYVIPSEPGTYSTTADTRYPAGMLVTGADLLPGNRQVSLIGYHEYMPVITTYTFSGSPSRINCGGRARIYPLQTGRQVEGICFDGEGRLFISSEKSVGKQAVFKILPSRR